MTEKQITTLVRLWQNRLGLGDWRIGILFSKETPTTPDDRKAFAVSRRCTHYDRGTIEFGPLKRGALPPSIEKDLIDGGTVTMKRYMEETVVHELLHFCLRDLLEASDSVREDIHPAARPVWDSAWRRAEESTVERLACALVESYEAV